MNGRAAFGWLVGVTLTVIPVWNVLGNRDLRTSGLEATVIRVEAPPSGSKLEPSVFITHVSGRELRCHGWGIEVGDRMLYDRDGPRCRAAAHVGWPAPGEWLLIGGGLFILFVGGLAQLHEWELSRRKRP